MNAVIIDTETTGIVEPDVVELAWIGPLHAFSSEPSIDSLRFKPRKPITLGALATHHILEEDLVAELEWPGQWSPPGEYIIGHNIDFDWIAIGKPEVKRICTLALARHLWPEAESHSLTALTYHLAADRRAARGYLVGAHSALVDVTLCRRLLGHILRALPDIVNWEQLWQASEKARIPTHLTFGKFGPLSDWAKANEQPRGLPIDQLRTVDPGYLSWLLSGKCDTVNGDPYLRKALETV